MQTVPDMDGTEVIIETTANGYNDFYKLWRKAEAGESEFMPIFLPWTVAPEYRAKVVDDFEMTGAEKHLAELHKLDIEQIVWRRNKISQLGGEELFCQEYPLTASEAFIAAQFDSFIPPDLVVRARKEAIEPYGDLIVGVDPAGGGTDFTAIAWRRGHCITKIEKRRDLDTMQVCGWIGKIIREDKPARVNVDISGLGIGIHDRLLEQHSGGLIRGVNFAGKPIEPLSWMRRESLVAVLQTGELRCGRTLKRRSPAAFRSPIARACKAISHPLGTNTIALASCSSKASRTCAAVACRHPMRAMRWRYVSANPLDQPSFRRAISIKRSTTPKGASFEVIITANSVDHHTAPERPCRYG
jgi:hypothetical protein